VGMRHRPAHFLHVFASDGYSAAYYSYLWADVLTADAYEAFLEAGGLYDRDVAERLRAHVLSAGNTQDPAEAYRRFRGRDPQVSALMRKRGLVQDDLRGDALVSRVDPAHLAQSGSEPFPPPDLPTPE